MKINTYPEMNKTIKDLLRMNQDDPIKAYTLTRLEELEQEVSEVSYKAYLYEKLKEEHDSIISKLADIRNLFDESDMEAEGHGMEDMIASPYAVACYAENKLQRLIKKVEEQEKILQLINKVAFETTKHQRELSKEGSADFNEELLGFAWSTNDIISDRK